MLRTIDDLISEKRQKQNAARDRRQAARQRGDAKAEAVGRASEAVARIERRALERAKVELDLKPGRAR